jgi:hypothetical protein
MTYPEENNFKNGDQHSSHKPPNQSDDGLDENAAGAIQPEDNSTRPFPEAGDANPEADYSGTDEDVAAFRRELDELRFTTPEPMGTEEPEPQVLPIVEQTTSRRRRRPARTVGRPNASELGQRLAFIIEHAGPTFDFFVFSFLCGCILSIGYLLDAPAILLIGILVAPLLAPWVGAALSVASGEIKLFGQTFGGMLTALIMVFIIGTLAGLASRIFQPLTLSQAFYHSRLWWPDLMMLIIGTVLLVFAFIQSDEKPMIASLMVAFEIYLPVSAAGFGLGSGVEGLWPQAGLVFLVHIALSLIVSLIVFFYMGFRPVELSGYVLAAAAILVGLIILAGFAGMGSKINVQGEQSSATPPVVAASMTPQPIIASITPRPLPQSTPSATLEPSATQHPDTPTVTSTIEPTLLPTPVYGRVQSISGGVMVRVKPGGASITTVLNGYLVEILGDTPIVLEGTTWVHVIIKTPTRDIDGWVLLSLILTATPSGSP